MDTESASTYKLNLSQELLEDIELGRLSPENLLLKTARLARLVGNSEIQQWLNFELAGYPGNDPTSLKFMTLTGRLTDRDKKLGYWFPLAQIDAQITMNKMQLQQMKIPDVTFAPSSSNPNEWVVGYLGQNVTTATSPINNVLQNLNALNSYVVTQSGIRSKVLALLHSFVTTTYYELAFSGMQQTIFEKQKEIVDGKLAKSCGSVLEKAPAIYDRLAQGEPEAISQALNTCRRMIDAFADNIFPPSEKTINIDGTEILLTAKHHVNRINVFIQENCDSTTRRVRFRHALKDLYERVSVGVHSDVTPEEARFLFFQTYMLIGEILSLKKSG